MRLNVVLLSAAGALITGSLVMVRQDLYTAWGMLVAGTLLTLAFVARGK